MVLGWLAICFLRVDAWSHSWLDTDLWIGVPSLYTSGLIAAAAAYLTAARLTYGLERELTSSSRRVGQLLTAHVLAALIGLVVAPIVVTTAAAATTAAMLGAVAGSLTGTFALQAFLVGASAVGIGQILGILVRSAIWAPAIALVMSLALAIIGAPIPATNHPWQAPSVPYIALQAIAAALMVSAPALALLARTRQRSNATRALSVCAVGTAACGALIVVNIPGEAQTLRPPPHAASCATASSGSSVCVWPAHEHLLPELVDQVTRFEAIATQLPWTAETWRVTSPGMATNTNDEIIVTPLLEDGGLWLSAQDLTFILPETCESIGEMSLESQQTLVDEGWAVADATTDFIYGSDRPLDVVLGEEPAPATQRLLSEPFPVGVSA